MREIFIRLLVATLATLGFSVFFYVHPRRLLPATLGGCIACAVYLVCGHFMDGEALPNFIAAAVGAIYSEILARVTRVPVPVYVLPAIIPLVPGSGLYKTMFNLVTGEYAVAASAGWTTLQVALGIAGGIAISSVVGYCLRARVRKKNSAEARSGAKTR